jgi:hypothetical protein
VRGTKSPDLGDGLNVGPKRTIRLTQMGHISPPPRDRLFATTGNASSG